MVDQKQAIAPYNFVPLPETINHSDEKPSRFDLFYQEPCNKRYTGELIIDARNKTPLFIRGPIKKDGDGSWNTSEDTRLRSQPFLDSDGTPIIPGSSFRGMIKTIVEILSYSKLTPVSNEKLFYRDLNSDDYKNAFICEEPLFNGGFLNSNYAPVNQRAKVYRSKVRTGFLRSDDLRWVIEECEYARVEHDLIQNNLQQSPFTAAGRAKLPNWEIQNSICYVQADAANTDYFFPKKVSPPADFYLRFKKVRSGLSIDPINNYEEATLVITGHMPNKHMEFCFLNERMTGNRFEVSDDMIEKFNDDAQITQKQQAFFPKDRPDNNCRAEKGYLRENEPVFFLTDDNNPDRILFFGRAMMFRFPYPCSPAELAIEHTINEETDFAQALFGKVANDNGCATSLKSRVYFGDLKCSSNDRLENKLIPPILASPKPTTFQHYLEQQGQKANNKYSGNSKLRGHKLYWHREKEKCNENISDIAILRQNPDADKQHTIIQPVKRETLFKGKIKFFNLTKIELGCLLDSLLLPKGCYHKIGMAKPLGFGSLQIQKSLKLQLFDPDANYAAWQNEPTKSHDDIDSFRKAFEEYILDFAKRNNVAIDKKQHGLRQLSRINELFTILNYNKKPANLKTRYMTIEGGDKECFGNKNEFKWRPILPKPSKV